LNSAGRSRYGVVVTNDRGRILRRSPEP
jgi:hypothetical protein